MRTETTLATIPAESLRPEHLSVRDTPRPHAEEIGAITPVLHRCALELLVRRPRRRILLVESEAFSGRALARILARWSFDVVTARTRDAAPRALYGFECVDLAIVALPDGENEAAELLAQLREIPALEHAPVLVVTGPESGLVDCGELRKHGVVGVIRCETPPEQVAFRVGQVLPLGSVDERRHVRVPARFAVELEANGERSTQRAENLSMGGIRIRSAIALEVNALVGLRFRLPMHPSESVAVEARVIHCQPAADGTGEYTVGLFFRSIPPRGRTLVEVEIVRMLTCSQFR